MSNFDKRFMLAIVFTLSIGLAGCGGSGGGSSDEPSGDPDETGDMSDEQDDSGETGTAQLRIVHAVADAPDVNIELDSGNATEIFEGLGFRETTALTEVAPGTFDVTVDAALPNGSGQEVLTKEVEITEGDETTLVAAGTVESRLAGTDPGLKLVEATPPDEPIAEDCGGAEPPCRSRYTVVHAAADAGPVEITALTPDNPSISGQPSIELDFENDNQFPVTVFAGLEQKPRRIRIVRDENPGQRDDDDDDVFFDTGAQLPPVPADEDILAIVIDNVGTGEIGRNFENVDNNPIRLLLIYPDGEGESNVNVFRDKDAQPAIRAAHLSQDAGNVDVLVGGQNVVLNNVPFTTVSGYLPVSETLRNDDDSLTVQVSESADGPVLGAADLELTNGDFHTGYAVGLARNTDPGFELINSNDSIRPVATEAQVRLVHAATQAGAVDVYATAEGGERQLVASGFDFKDISPYRSLSIDLSSGSTDYTFEVFAAGADPTSAAPVIEAPATLTAGSVTTAVARDDDLSVPTFAPQLVNDAAAADALN